MTDAVKGLGESEGKSGGGKVFFVSLGCPKNRVDSEIMLGELKKRAYDVVDSAEEADLLVVNTCSFVEEAREESVDTILELAKAKTDSGNAKKLVVAGCLAQRYSADLEKEIPEVDAFLGTGDHWRIGELLGSSPAAKNLLAESGGHAPIIEVGRPGYNYDAYSPRLVTTPPWTAYVKIAEGCSQRCSFCIIPRLRGGAKSRPIDDIVREVEDLAGRGVREVNLIAQDLTHYGDDRKDGTSLSQLLRELVKVNGVHWLRLLYCYPHNFTDELVDLIGSEPKIASYVDMPLQHISDRMLEIMRRRFSEQGTRDLVRNMRARIPDLVFRTTFIVGHPGETEDDFKRLYDFVGESRFERVGVFKYSREDGTHAARRDDHVMGLVKEDRYHRLMTLQQGISEEIQQGMVGREVDLLIEGPSKETELLLEGRTWGQAPEIDGVTYVNAGWAPAGSIVRAEIVEAGDYDLVARIVGGEGATPAEPLEDE
ncbi:MAG: 30S ribosomal protein S12 methylthiotransferase RimO [Deltaproteobacteria bacterium]|nr:30S ribosomal protein S12 methylthiotransferase RimO [Deltaproteobacteria bacterium]